MRKTTLTFVSILVMIFLVQCKGSREVVNSSFFPVKEITIDYEFDLPEKLDENHEVYGVTLKGDILSLNVKYYYGEELHDFKLITNGLYQKTLPPVVHLYLASTEKGGEPEKLVFQEIQFDISSIKQWGTDQIVLRILGYPNVVIYRFDK